MYFLKKNLYIYILLEIIENYVIMYILAIEKKHNHKISSFKYFDKHIKKNNKILIILKTKIRFCIIIRMFIYMSHKFHYFNTSQEDVRFN